MDCKSKYIYYHQCTQIITFVAIIIVNVGICIIIRMTGWKGLKKGIQVILQNSVLTILKTNIKNIRFFKLLFGELKFLFLFIVHTVIQDFFLIFYSPKCFKKIYLILYFQALKSKCSSTILLTNLLFTYSFIYF